MAKKAREKAARYKALEKKKKNWKRSGRKRNVKVKTEKGQSDAGQTMRCLCRGPEGRSKAQANRNRKPLKLGRETYKTNKRNNSR
jgi:hypothetical protein